MQRELFFCYSFVYYYVCQSQKKSLTFVLSRESLVVDVVMIYREKTEFCPTTLSHFITVLFLSFLLMCHYLRFIDN